MYVSTMPHMFSVFVFLLLVSVCVVGESLKAPDDNGPKGNTLAHGFGDDIEWVKWEDAAFLSDDLNRPIFLLIHKTWCGACQSLKQRASADPKRKDFVELSQKFVMVNLEDDEEPQDRKYAPDGGYIPRLFFLDRLGDPLPIDNKEKFPKNPHFYPELSQIIIAMNKALTEFDSVPKSDTEQPKEDDEKVDVNKVEEEVVEDKKQEKVAKKEEKSKKEKKADETKAQPKDQKGDRAEKKKPTKEETNPKERKSDELKKQDTKEKTKDTEEPKATCPHAAKAKKEAEKQKKKQPDEKKETKEDKGGKDKKNEKQKKKKSKDEPKDEL